LDGAFGLMPKIAADVAIEQMFTELRGGRAIQHFGNVFFDLLTEGR